MKGDKFPLGIAILILAILVAIVFNRETSDTTTSTSTPGETSDETGDVNVDANEPAKAIDSGIDETSRFSSARTIASTEQSVSILQRGPNQRLILPPHETLDWTSQEPEIFDKEFFSVNPGSPSGRLTFNENTLSAVEAGYDSGVVDRFIGSGSSSFRLPIDKDRVVEIKVDRIVDRGSATKTLVGKVKGDPFSDATLVFHDGAVSGSLAFYDSNTHYEYGLAGNGNIAIRKLDPSTYTAKCEHNEDSPSTLVLGSNDSSELADSDNPEEYPEPDLDDGSPGESSEALYNFDSVIGYGSQSRIDEGGTAAIEARIIAAVDRTNTAFLNSQIADTEMVLLATMEDPDYVYPGASAGTMGSSDELGFLDNPSDGVLDSITGLRDLVGADQAGFVVTLPHGGAAGVAYRPGRSMIVARTYMSSTALTFVHEFGHNLGCQHGWGDGGGTGFDTNVSSYGWRFQTDDPTPTKYRTVMAYDFAYTRIPHFSDPDIRYPVNPSDPNDGFRTGAIDGYDASEDDSVDPRLVFGGIDGNSGAGYDGSNPDLGARNADSIVDGTALMMNRATRASPVSGPEISIQQPSGTELTSGSSQMNYPSTSFPLMVEKSFVIRNLGDSDLTGISASIAGANPSDFSVVVAPPSSLGSLSLAQFKVAFTPNSTGSKSAVLQILSNDSDESPFTIDLSGTGVAAIPVLSDDFDPDIDFSLWSELGASLSATTNAQAAGAGSSGNSLRFSGFGVRQATTLPIDTSSGGNVSFSFAKADITTNASGWSAAEAGEDLVVEYTTDGSTWVQMGGPYSNIAWEQKNEPIPVAAQASAVQFRFRQIAHSNGGNDNVAIENVLIAPDSGTPEITLEQPAGNNLSDGISTVAFSSTAIGGSSSLVFTVSNVGTASLTGLGVTFSGTHDSEFSLSSPPPSSILPGSSATFTVQFSPGALGSRTAELHLASNDSDENPFDVSLTGSGIDAPPTLTDDFDPDHDPGLWAEFGASVAANTTGQQAGAGSTGNSLWFGGDGSRFATTVPINTTAGGEVKFLFVAASTNNPPTWETADPGEELVLEYSTDGTTFTPIGGTIDSTTWQEFLIPIPAGAQTASTQFRFRQLSNSGADFDHCAIEDVEISGTFADPEPEITLEQPTGTGLTDGVSSVDFGSEETGAASSRTFTIRNVGGADLTGVGTTIGGTDAGEFSVISPPSTTISPGGISSFTIEWTPASAGAKTASLQVASNDSNENPFDIGLTGTGNDPAPRLTSLSLSAGTLNPVFQPEQITYVASVGLATASIAVTPATDQTSSTIDVRVNGGSYDSVSSGSASSALPLDGGVNSVDVRVTSPSGNQNFVYSIEVWRGYQEITFPPVESLFSDSGPFSLNATSSSGLPVSYTITAGSGVVNLSGDIVTPTGIFGPVTIRASQAGNANYGAAEDVYSSFYVSAPQSPISETAVGRDFTVILRQDGTLWSWGSNTIGQLGQSDRIDRSSPTRIGTDTDWATVRTGSSHTLALKSDGSLWAWGNNSGGRLGDGSILSFDSPNRIGSDSDWEKISAGDDFSHGIRSNGTLWAWGFASGHQLGTGSTQFETTPVQIGANTDWLEISSGDRHVIALKTDGSLWAWGTNSLGQVGDGTTTTVPTPVQVGTDMDWSKIFAGHFHNVALKSDGSLWAWGSNSAGKLGDGTFSNRYSPVQVGTETDWDSIAAGYTFSLGRKADGTLWGWGGNIFGELGDTTRSSKSVPTQIGSRADWPSLAVSNSTAYRTVIAGGDGFPWTWGGLTLINPRGKTLPAPVLDSASMPEVESYALGDGFTLAITDDGSLWSWGDNFNGKLGDNGSVERQEPFRVGADTDWKTVAAGDNHSAAIKTDGSLWTWGDGFQGQLGSGSTADRGIPGQVGSATDWSFVSSGDDHSIALKNNGSLWGWGHNSFGQVGDGTTTNQLTPIQIGSVQNWTSISAGDRHNLALRSDGTLWAWGDNDRGQLGDGTTTDSIVPQQLGTNTDWDYVSAGQSHSAAIKTDGSLWLWGYNIAGQVGNGTMSLNQTTPVRIGSDTDWVAVSCGYYHTLALKVDGSLWAWGDNALAKLGLGDLVDRSSPTRVGTWNGWEKLPTGSMSQSFYSVVAGRNGTLWAFGDNWKRQIGLASVETRIPARVIPLSPQQLSIPPEITRPQIGGTVTLNATASSGLPVEYEVSGDATLDGNQLTATGAGPITVFAYQGGDTIWDSAGVEEIELSRRLSTLSLSEGPLSPVFDPDIFSYSVTADAGSNGISVTPTAEDPSTVIEVRINDGSFQTVSSGSTSALIPLPVGVNTLEIRTLKSSGSVSRLYSVTVTRPVPSDDSSLTSLSLGGEILQPSFSPTTLSYVSVVDEPTTSVSLTAVTSDDGAATELQIDGGSFVPISSGVSSGPIPFDGEDKTLGIRVTAEDDVSTTLYSIVVTTGTQEIFFPPIEPKSTDSTDFSLNATSSRGLPIQYAIVSGDDGASLSGNIITLTGITGPVTVVASQPGNGTFRPAEDVYQTFYVSPVGADIAQIALMRHADILLKSDGTLWSRGYNGNGELGNGSDIDQRDFGQIGTDSDWSAISTGYNHALALKTDGSLWAWGYQASGQLGNGITNILSQRMPIRIGSGTDWSVISAGDDFSLALKSDGSLWSWGDNDYGVLGDGTTSDTDVPTRIGLDTNWKNLACGQRHVLATKTDGTLWAWGTNFSGSLGNGSSITDSFTPARIGTDTDWDRVAAGAFSSFAFKNNGTLWSWGQNGGVLGLGNTLSQTTPQPVGSDTDWAEFAVGFRHVNALKSDGSLWVWGANLYGEQGDTSGDPVLSPRRFDSRNDYSAVATTMNTGWRSLVAFDGRSLKTWGGNSRPKPVGTAHPYPISSFDENVEEITVGTSHSMAILEGGTLWSWGFNFAGKLGDGTQDNRPEAKQVGSDTDWKHAAAGDFHSIAVKTDGTLWGWGEASLGAIGSGNSTDQFSPNQIGSETDWDRVAVGDDHSLGLKTDGTLWGWGHNLFGQVGNNSNSNVFTPAQVGSDNDWEDFSAGDRHSLAVKSDGTLWAWGDNDVSQLGNDSTTDENSPIQVGSDTDWSSVSAGDGHSLALKTDGTLWAWGVNDGRLGNGEVTIQRTPIQVGSDSDWAAVVASFDNSMALKSDGTLWAWGDNLQGRIGDGTYIKRLSPVQVGSANHWTKLPAGGWSKAKVSYAISVDGTLWGWGDDANRLLADASFDVRIPRFDIPIVSQNITFPDISRPPLGQSTTLQATSDSGMPITYLVSGDAEISGDQLTVTGPGSISIHAYQRGDNIWDIAGPVSAKVVTPEISVEQPLSNLLTDGSDTINYGSVEIGQTSLKTFTIRNLGADPLENLSVEKSGTAQADFSVSLLSSTSLQQGETATFTVEFQPSNTGPRIAAIQVVSNDYDENPFDIDLSGTGITPEIMIDEQGGGNLTDGVSTSVFGSVSQGSDSSKTYTIRNDGTATLTGLSLLISGPDDAQFSKTDPLSTTLAPSASTTFTVTFAPSGFGPRSASLQVASNDIDENPFDIALTGTAFAPEISIEEPVGVSLSDGSATTDFGGVPVNTSSGKTYTIRNVGNEDLTGISVGKSGTDAPEFSIGSLGSTSLSPGATTTFSVTLTPVSPGAKTAALQISSNDLDESPFDISLSGIGLSPEISVEEPEGTSLTDGSATTDFGGVPVETSEAKTYTIRNLGNDTLTGLAVGKSGTNAGEFSVGSPGSTSLAPGASTTFSVTLTPTSAGAKSAALQISSNDLDENPFNIALSGSGLAPEISITRLSAEKAEGTGGITSFTFTVSRSGYVGGTTTLDYSTTGSGGDPATAADFQGGLPSGSISFEASETSQTVTLPVIADHIVEPDQGFTVTLSNPSAGATFDTMSATGTIQNDDVLTVTIDTPNLGDDEAVEGGSPGSITLTHNEPGRATPVTVSLSTASSVAGTDEFSLSGSGVNFTGATGTATIPANQTATQVSVNALPDASSEAEADEDIIVQVLANAPYVTGTPAFATVTIEQNGFLVNNTADFDPVTTANGGTGTLRQAILNANALGGNPTVEFDTTTSPFDDATPDSIVLTKGELEITQSLVLEGLGARMLSISAGGISRVFTIDGDFASSITLQDLTIRDGNSTDGGGIRNLSAGSVSLVNATVTANIATGRGGGIFNNGTSELSIYESTIAGNLAANTGGIFMESGSSYLRGSTISGNSAISTGSGGITVSSTAALEVSTTTITNNQSPDSGGGLFNDGGSVTPDNTILAGNNGPTGSTDISGNGVLSSGYNLVGDASGTAGIHGFSATGDQVGTSGSPIDAKLLPLSNNGGPTDTHGLRQSSPAIEAGDNTTAGPGLSPHDQRGIGFPRAFDRDGDGTATIDIGSFEAGLPDFVINEIDIDDAGDDNFEFVEIYDGGVGNTDLVNVVLVFFDGSNDQSYHAIDLTGQSTDGDGYLLVGNVEIAGADVTFADDLIRNAAAGASGAVALFLGTDSNFPSGTDLSTTGLVDSVVYKFSGEPDDTGLAPLLLHGQPQLDENSASNQSGHSLQRLPNGGIPRETIHFIPIAPTPGFENAVPTGPSTPDLDAISDTGVADDDDLTKLARPTLSGTGVPGSLLTFTSDQSGLIGTVPVDENGEWSFVPSVDLPDETHQITAQADAHAQSGAAGTSASLAVEIDTIAPSVTIEQSPSQADPATGAPLEFTAVFSEDVNGFDAADINVGGSAVPSDPIVGGGPSSFTISIGSIAGEGTVIASIGSSTVEDAAGNFNIASTSTDNLVVIDFHGSTVESATDIANGGGSGTAAGWLGSDDLDAFTFTITVTSYVTVSTTGALDTFGEVRNSNDDLVNDPDGDDNLGDGENFSSFMTLGAGQYTALVSTRSSGEGEYELDLAVSPVPPPVVINDNTLLKSQLARKIKKLKKAAKKAKKKGNTSKAKKIKKQIKKLTKQLRSL